LRIELDPRWAGASGTALTSMTNGIAGMRQRGGSRSGFADGRIWALLMGVSGSISRPISQRYRIKNAKERSADAPYRPRGT